ncbi:MAG: hypothetical protein IPG78_19395 [Ignavibacteria bacterium]|nr:hypothetical protein [Ignavibacteria bacterium]
MTSSPFQKYSPWRYYSNYVPMPSAGFRPNKNILSLNLTMLIEGFYDNASNTMTADTLKVFLRNSLAPYLIMDSAKAVVSTAGTGTFNFLNAVNGQPYYVVLKHRNSIETWSYTAISFTGDILNYNFTDFIIKAYGGNLKLIIGSSPIKYGIFSGDVNQDGTIDASDVSETDNDAYSSASGYVRTDVTGDDFVDAGDVSIVDNNAFNSVSAVTP